MATLSNGTQQITVPDDVADSYASRGWVRPGTPALAEPGLDTLTIADLLDHAQQRGIELAGARKKADIRAAIDAAGTVTETVTDPETAQ